MSTRHDKKYKDNIYYQHNSIFFIQLLNLVKQHPLSYFKQLNATKFGKYQNLKIWIDNEIPLLSDSYYKITTKCY